MEKRPGLVYQLLSDRRSGRVLLSTGDWQPGQLQLVRLVSWRKHGGEGTEAVIKRGLVYGKKSQPRPCGGDHPHLSTRQLSVPLG